MRLVEAGKDTAPLLLGRSGENAVTCVTFDISDWVSEFGDGDVYLLHKRQQDSAAYVASADLEDGIVTWTVTSIDTAYTGKGQCELQYIVGEQIVKSRTHATLTLSSLENSGESPTSGTGWVAEMLASMQEIVDSVPVVAVTESDDGLKTLTVTITDADGNTSVVTITDGAAATIAVGTVTTGDAGTEASVTNSGTENAAIFDFVIPKGDKGDTGNLIWPEFDIDEETGELIIVTADEYEGPSFEITEDGILEVTYV